MLRIIKKEDGASLVEALISLALLGLIGSAFLMSLSVSIRAVLTSDEDVIAESLARSQMESVRDQEYAYAYPLINGQAEYEVIDTSGYPGFSIYSVARNGGDVEGVIGIPWDSENNQAENKDSGLQMIKLVIKNNERSVYFLEMYKVYR